MHPDIRLACLLDQIDIHILFKEKVFVLSVDTGEARIKGWRYLRIGQNANIHRQTVIDPVAVVPVRQLAHIQAADVGEATHTFVGSAASRVDSIIDFAFWIWINKAALPHCLEHSRLNCIIGILLNDQTVVVFANIGKFQCNPRLGHF